MYKHVIYFLIGRIGKKIADRTILRMLKEKKIKHKLFIQEYFSVGKKSRFYLDNKQIFRIDNKKLKLLNPDVLFKGSEYKKKKFLAKNI